MRVLKKQAWASFLNEDHSFNGNLFEELVGVLLHEQFSEQWSQTQASWDGGKDFEKDYDGGEGYSWAECKIYGKTISIRTISNTLVMAVNEENVREILIFSYSRLNSNAVGHLGDFSSATGIKVNVFDDELLELLILRSRVATTKYFKNIEVNPYQIEPFSVRSFLSNSPHIERVMLNDQEGLHKSRKALFEINSACLFEIFILSNQKLTLTIDFEEILKSKDLLGLLNYDHLSITRNVISVDLTEGQIESLKLYFAPSRSGNFKFPSVKISNSIDKKTQELGGNSYEVSRVHYPPLIGADRLSILENDFRAKISANQQTICFTISGKSGVGKTRLLHECKRLLFRENYSVRHIDCHSSSYHDHTNFVRTLLSQVWRLPYPVISDEEESLRRFDGPDSGNVYAQLHDILYHNSSEQDFLSKKQLSQLCALLVQGILKQRLAIIIDNVQFLEEPSIHLLQMAYNTLVNAPGQNVLLLSFNQEDLLFSDVALSFYTQIKERAARKVESEMYYELREFNESQIELFLDSVLKSDDPEYQFTIHYPLLTQLIKNNILPRPLDLWQFILAARDEEVVAIDDGYFFIHNESRFIELIKTIQKNTSVIYDYRLKKLSSDYKLLELLFLLANIGDVQPRVLNRLHYSEEQILKLIDSGILKHGPNGAIEFYHPSIEKYIVNKLEGFTLFQPSIRQSATTQFLQSDLSEAFPLASFLLQPDPSSKEVLRIVKLLKDTVSGFPSVRIRLAANKVREYLLASSTIAASEYIDMVYPLCMMSAKEGNRNVQLAYLKEFKDQLTDFVPANKLQAKQYFGIAREICSAQMASYQAKETIDALNASISEMHTKLNHLSTDVYEELHANFLNRQCVCYKNLKKVDEALKVGELAREIAIKCNALGLACLCMVDIGYIYFSEVANRKKILMYWDEAVEFYYQNKETILEQVPAMKQVILLIESCCLGLRKKYSEAFKNIDELVTDCFENGSFFYLMQSKLTKAILVSRELLELKDSKPRRYSFEDVIQIARSVEDAAIVSEMNQFYRYSLHLQAIAWERLKEPDKASICYTGLLKILLIQGSQKNGTLSFNDEMIVRDAWDFHSFQKSGRDLMPVLRSFVMRNTPANLEESADRPFSIFSVRDINLPLH